MDQPKTLATIKAALREAGLPEHLIEAGDTNSHDPALRRSHQEGINLVGQEVGSPIIAIPNPDPGTGKIAFFGPVVNPSPIGEQAARLWDSVVGIASIPSFYEMKRTRTFRPDLRRAATDDREAVAGPRAGCPLDVVRPLDPANLLSMAARNHSAI